MKKLLKFVAVSAVAAIALSFTGCSNTPTLEKIKKDGVITMATNAEFAPFEYFGDGNEIKGVDVDIANEIAKDLGVKLEVKHMDFDAVVPAVKSGKFSFGAAGLSVTEERMESVDFSIKYIKSKQYMIVKKDSSIKAEADLNGKKIGVQTGTTADFFATYDPEDPNENVKDSTVERYKSSMDAAVALASGKIDVVITDTLPSQKIVEANKDLKLIDTPLVEEEYALCVKKGNKELLEAMNKTLERLIKEGKIDSYVLEHMK